ncbi:hypothetical protein F4781DRAFT_440089 [Annulohypoxylon bovei var. microspora]|nr:hypothetical protein F4781DRAFT_440089 [Annulohypoxylon bovei var. microspora]
MSSEKRKQPWEYSTNKGTIRVRRRRDTLPEEKLILESGKISDTKAITRVWRLRADTEEYKMASEEEKKRMLIADENMAMERRRSKGQDVDSKIARFLQRQNLAADGENTSVPNTATTSPDPLTGGGLNFEDHQPSGGDTRSFGLGSFQTAAAASPSPSLSYIFEQDDTTDHGQMRPRTQQAYEDYGQEFTSQNTRFTNQPTATDQTYAALNIELNSSQVQIRDLKNQVRALSNELNTTRANVTELERRVNQMQNIAIVPSDDWRFAADVRALADAAAKVSNRLNVNKMSDSERHTDQHAEQHAELQEEQRAKKDNGYGFVDDTNHEEHEADVAGYLTVLISNDV